MNPSRIITYFDLFFCLVFLPLIFTLIPVSRWMLVYPFFAFTVLVFLYVVYFSIRLMRIPQKVMEKKYLQVALFWILLLLLTYFLSQYPYPNGEIPLEPDGRPTRRRIQTVWFLFLVVSGYSLSLSLIVELFRQQIMKKELMAQKKTAELALYRAQINPHFFFNTMNTLYGLVVSRSAKAENAFVLFSDIMKFTYTFIDREYIPIREELKYIRDYIALQQLRLGELTKVDLEVDIDDMEASIPPMVLIPFVENAFKYGTSSSLPGCITVRIRLEDGMLEFFCENNIMNRHENTAVGIENTKSRLDLIYPAAYRLEAGEHDGKYSVSLKIRLK